MSPSTRFCAHVKAAIGYAKVVQNVGVQNHKPYDRVTGDESNSKKLFDPFLLLFGMAVPASSVKADGPLIVLPRSQTPVDDGTCLRLLQPQPNRARYFASPGCSV